MREDSYPRFYASQMFPLLTSYSTMFHSLNLFGLFFVTLPIILVHAQNSNLWPAAYPLAVRSPYLQAWESSMNGTQTMTNWPMLWSNAVCIRDFACSL